MEELFFLISQLANLFSLFYFLETFCGDQLFESDYFAQQGALTCL